MIEEPQTLLGNERGDSAQALGPHWRPDDSRSGGAALSESTTRRGARAVRLDSFRQGGLNAEGFMSREIHARGEE